MSDAERLFRDVQVTCVTVERTILGESNPFNFSTYGASIRDHVGMWEEEYDIIEDGVENVLNEAGFDLQTPMYNIMGVQVDPSYKGIVIQNGKKMLLQ